MKGNVIYIALSAVFGILLGYFSFHVYPLVFSSFYVLFLLLRKREIFLFCLAAMIGLYAYFIYTDGKNRTMLNDTMTQFSVRFVAPVTIDGDRLIGTAETSKREKVKISYRIRSQEEKQRLSRLSVGMVCSFSGVLEIPEPARNPYAFNYKNYLYFQRIHWLLKPHALSLDNCRPTPLSFHEKLIMVRQRGIAYIEQHFPKETIGIVQALVYGEREQMSETLLEGYQKLGLIHLLAISGLHVTMLTGMGFFLAIRAGMTRETAALLLLFLLPMYTLLTGASPSAVRASLMAGMVLITLKWPTKLLPIDSLSIACIIMLLFNPYTLFQAGFQLSFMAALALILSSHTILQPSSSLRQLVLTTVIAQLSLLPLLLYHFFEISLLSFPLNVIFVPLYSFIVLPLSLISLIGHHFFAPIGKIFIFILEKILFLTNHLVELLASHSSFVLTLGRPSPLLLFCYCIAILFVFVEFEKMHQRWQNYKGIFFLLFVIIADWFAPYFDAQGEVVLLDVGQGDCIYIELPYRKGVYLIDTGGVLSFSKPSWQKRKDEFEVGDDVVVPFLKAKGVSKLDKLIITHGDYDHMGAAQTIIEQITVKELLIGKNGNEDHLQKRLIQAAKRHHVSVREISRGEKWNAAGISFYALSPPRTKSEASRNNRSIVLYTKLGGLLWLFLGDLEESGEQELIRAFPNLRADVLKVGHHGSDTSTSEALLKQIKPKVALISVGKHNRYGHPHETVIQRLRAYNISILRTDWHGAIQFIYTKKAGTFTTMLP
ncbi:DNA internalization-related competence protein ComEC/Rec2 [Bacillus alveayuensis]|jgi:competence protein ComEC|uniref:DNA internalization-related competence protein ComEC/Rec2 n=1 Tax=Aeribacillus alveayuensis TaxID=279215 RepID=UPI0005D0FFC9|nr:DNA internalization-related competence protein ComEC/Rec2 [Bacillus alveayuensis]